MQAASRPRTPSWRRRGLLLSGTALSLGVLLSMAEPRVALAGCVDVTSAPNTVECDAAKATTDTTYNVTAGGNDEDRDDRHYLFTADGDVEVEITAGGDIDGFGLAVTSTEAGAAFTVDHQGAISVDSGNNPTEGGEAVFNLTTNDGDVSYSGGGSVIDNDGGNDALVIDAGAGFVDFSAVAPNYQGNTALWIETTRGDQTISIDGGTLQVTDSLGDGVFASSISGDIVIEMIGNTAITTTAAAPNSVWGLSAETDAGSVDISSDANIGTAGFEFDIGISSFSGGTADITQTGGTMMATDFGIHVDAGDRISVTTDAGSKIEMSGGTGIYASAFGSRGSVVVTVNGEIDPPDIGVDASIVDPLNPDSVIVHQNTDLSANVTGIIASHAGTGSILIDGAGNVVAGTDGIVATQTNNAPGTFGHITIAGSGDTEGTAGVGITAEITGENNAGNITVDRSGAVAGADAGILASTAGSGFVIVKVRNDVSASDGNAVETAAVDGLNTVDLVAGIVSATGDGVNATSTGTGGILVDMSGGQIGTAATPVGGNGILARSTAAASDGDIDVNATTIHAQGRGVLAEILNPANDGNITVDVADNGTVEGGVTAETAGTGNAIVTIGDDAVVTGNSPGSESITAGGNAIQIIGSGATVTGSSGVVVDQTSPAGTGIASVLVGNNSTIEGLGGDATDPYNGNGIFAGNQGTGPTSVITGDGTSVTGDANGIVAFQTNAANANDITISTDGPVRGEGDTAFVLAPYTDAFAAAGGLPTTGIGIGASTRGSGDIIVSAGGTVFGDNAGIQTLASGGNIQISAASTVDSNGNAIDAITSGSGAVSITTEDAVSGGANGIRAESDTGNLTVTANGTVSGTSGDGIQAVSPGGNVTVTANEAVSGGDDGIEATGSIVTVTSNVSAAGGSGSGIEANGGLITISASGTTSGGTDGIQARSTSGEDITITTAGTVTGGQDGVDAIVTGGDGDISIAANATITGGVDGISASTEDGNISIAGSGGITGGSGQGIEAQSTAGGSIDVNATGDVSGATGILLSVTGPGTIDLATGGTVTGTAGDGIRTSAVNGDTTITTSDTVTGVDDGIDASATGDGAIIITTNAAVTGTADDGIVTSAFDGDTTITTNAAVSGGGDGIDATATGAGAITIDTSAAVTGGDVGIVTSAVAGDTAIQAGADVSGGSDGINATATGIGNVAISTIAGTTISGTTGNGIAAQTASGNLVIGADADIVGGTNGIFARTGTGDIDITGGGDITGTSGSGIDAASTGGSIDVAVSGTVSGSTGIIVSVAGGETIDLTTGAVIGTAGDAINTSAGTGATTITTNGTVTGAEDGIEAQSTGGPITVTTNDDVTGGANGVLVDAASGAVTITTNAAVTGNGGDGINASGGSVQITTGGAVSGTDDGIEASGSTVTIDFGDAVTGGDEGISATATGAVVITGSSDVTGGSGAGITGTSAGGTVAVNVTGAVTGATGIELATTGGGAVNLFAGGPVEGTSGDGINTSAETGPTTITTNGTVTGAEDGIEAESTDGAITIAANDTVVGSGGDGIRTTTANGDTSITVRDDVTGQEDGIDASATGNGKIDVTVIGGVTVRGLTESGIDIATNTGTATVNNSGLIEGASEAIKGATNALIEIFNSAAGTLRNIGGAPDDVAIATEGPTNIVNDGLIVGRVNTGIGNDSFINRGGLTWETRGISDFGAGSDTIRNEGRIVVAHDPVVSETTKFDNLETFVNTSSGVIDMVEGDLTDPAAGNEAGTKDTLTIAGTYTGHAGSRIEMDVALTADRNPQDNSDRVILGTGAGTSDLLFNIVATPTEAVVATTQNTDRVTFDNGQILANPITVVENRGTLRTTSGDGPVPLARSGLVNYDLISAGGDFQIVSQLDEGIAGGLLLPIPATLAAVALTSQKSPTPITAGCIDPAARQSAQAGWARGHGGEFRTQTEGTQITGGRAGDPLTSDNETRFFTLQGGLDTVFCDFDGIGGNLHLGVTVGNTWGESVQRNDDPARGIFGTDVEFESFFIGPYAAYSRGSFALLTALRFDDHELELRNAELIRGKPLEVDGDGISGSAAASYDISISQIPLAPQYQFILTPEVGLNVSRTRVDDFDIGGGTVELDDLWSALGHFGLTGRTTITAGDSLFVTPFASGTVYREFITEAQSQFVLGGETIDAEANRVGTYGQVGIGVNAVQLGDVAAGQPTYFGGARVDMQFGERLQGFTASLYGRIQF